MFPRIVTRKKGGRTYHWLHIVETFRTEEGKVRQRSLANLGNVNHISAKDIGNITKGLNRIFGIGEPEEEILDDPAESLDVGGSYAVLRIWDQLGWGAVIQKCLRGTRHSFDVTANIKTLVTNRLLDPCSKLHILEWHKGVFLPGIPRNQITYNHLLRAMDFLERNKKKLEVGFSNALIDLFSLDVNIIFYDVTSTYFEIDRADGAEEANPQQGISTLRQKGYSRDKRGDLPQVTIGLVMTQEGIPLAHHVFPGNRLDKTTLEEIVTDLKGRFRIRRCTFIGDRGMLSEENLAFLRKERYDFIIAHPLRQHKDAKEVLKEVEKELREKISQEVKRARKKNHPIQEVIVDTTVMGRRFVVAHHEEIAKETKKTRVRNLKKAEALIEEQVEKLNRQDEGEVFRGRKLSDEGALLKIHDYLRDKKLLRYYDIHLDDKKMLQWSRNEKACNWEKKIDGKLILETSGVNLSPEQVVRRYKDLQEIERCFRIMKSSLDLRPVFHRVDRRIRAHAFLCVMALQIDRLMRCRLRKANISRLPSRVLETLSRQRTIKAKVEGKAYKGLTTATVEQLELFKALDVPKPTLKGIEGKTRL